MVLVQPDGVTWAVTVSGDVPNDTGALRGIVTSALAAAFPRTEHGVSDHRSNR